MLSQLFEQDGEGRRRRMPRKFYGTGLYDSVMNLGARLTDDPKNPKNRLFPGEKHALLYNDKFGRYEPAQFMGPGTALKQRTLMNQMGISKMDTASKAHDLRYTLGSSNADIKAADDKFYAVLNQLRKSKGDNRWNLNMANLLKIKDYLPVGSTFGDSSLTDAERERYKQQLAKLVTMGYGKKDFEKIRRNSKGIT